MNQASELSFDIELDIPEGEMYIFHEKSFEIPIVGFIFDIPGISSIIAKRNKLEIIKNASQEWNVIKPRVLAAISEYHHNKTENNFSYAILDVLYEKVNPLLNSHGMNAMYRYHEEKNIYIEIVGMSEAGCSSCVSESCNSCDINTEEPEEVLLPQDLFGAIERIFRTFLKDEEIKVIKAL